MERNPASIASETFDLAIIGGGIFGAAAAWDAALRGLKTVLIEAKDFGSGASAECFKMVHGGIRYLQHGDLKRLHFSCAERSALLRIAPHLVNPLPIVIPTYGWGRQGKFLLGAGTTLYDLLTFNRNANLSDPLRQVPPIRLLGKTEVLELFPDLNPQSLTGAAVFNDGQIYSPARLVLSFVKSAVNAGAVACNYLQATEFLWDDKRVRGVRVQDQLSGNTFDVRANLVLNAAGPGAEYLLSHPHFGKWQRGRYSRDAYFIVNRPARTYHALAVQGQSRDRDAFFSRAGRHLFVVPWRDYSLIGVWHRPFADRPETARVNSDEIGKWISELAASYPTLQLRREEVIYANCGLVPFGKSNVSDEDLSFGKESRFIDHRKMHGVAGLVTLIGIRFTTGRGDAARALDLLLEQLPKRPGRASTDTLPLIGGDIDDFERFQRSAHASKPAWVSKRSLDALLRNHGTQHKSVLALADLEPNDAHCVGRTDTISAEISHAVISEMAVHLADAVLRRTDMGSGAHPGTRALEAAALQMQKLLQWSDRQRVEELASTEKALYAHQANVREPRAPAALNYVETNIMGARHVS